MAAGTMFGPAVAGSLYKNVSWQITMLVLAMLCALGSVQVYRYTGGPQKYNEDQESTSEH